MNVHFHIIYMPLFKSRTIKKVSLSRSGGSLIISIQLYNYLYIVINNWLLSMSVLFTWHDFVENMKRVRVYNQIMLCGNHVNLA